MINDDKLKQRVREMAREARNLELDIAAREEELERSKARLKQIKDNDLVDLFFEAGIDAIGIPAEGNMPAYDLTLKPFFAANIAASWPDEKKQAAFEWLDDHGAGDLIKSVLTVELPRGDYEKMKAVRNALQKLNISYDIKLAVPHSTLTAYVRNQIEEHNTTPPLELLGARVGQTVKLEPRK